MTWLRIDDSFGDHPKLLCLTRSERWTFVELLCYCAKHRTEGYFPTTLGESRTAIKPALLNKFLEVGLVDREPSGELRVHDFDHYNPPTKDPTGQARQQRWRNAHRNGPRNGRVTENVTPDVTASRARDPVPKNTTRRTEGSSVSATSSFLPAVSSYAAPPLTPIADELQAVLEAGRQVAKAEELQ